MSQHDFDISVGDANTGATFRTAINLALKALASSSSGDSAPNPTWPGMFWYDTLNEKLKIRDATNTAWNESWNFGGGGAGLVFANTGLEIQDTDASHTLTIKPGSNLSADRILTIITGDEARTITLNSDAILPSPALVDNLKFVVNASVNKLDIFTKSGGAVPDGTNFPTISIPDGTGLVQRTRAATYLSGTSQFIMADAANYWSKGSLDAEIKTAYVYAIWDGTGIVWALGGYSGFTRCPESTTATDDDFFLLEASSTLDKSTADTLYCVCVGKIRYQYDTGDAPDHTIQATVLDAPQVIWNPKSDYGYTKNLATSITTAGNLADASVVSVVVKQSGKYNISQSAYAFASAGTLTGITIAMKTGSAVYASATQRAYARSSTALADESRPSQHSVASSCYLQVGDTIHLGASISVNSGNSVLVGDSQGAGYVGSTSLTFYRID